MANTELQILQALRHGESHIRTVHGVWYEMRHNDLSRLNAMKFVASKTDRKLISVQKNPFRDRLGLRKVAQIDEALKTDTIIDMLKREHREYQLLIDLIDRLFEGPEKPHYYN